MQEYNYLAINSEDSLIKGILSAVNEQDLERKLSDMQLELISAKVAKNNIFEGLFNTVDKREVMLLCIHLHELEKSGVTIVDALKNMHDSIESKVLKRIIYSLYESVRNGSMLSEAFAQHPKVFDEVFVNLVASGEQTGKIGAVFGYLVDHIKWKMELEGSVKKAIAYPIFMLFVLISMLIVMMLFVVPQINAFLSDQGIELPFYSKMLVSVSNFFVNDWHILLIGIGFLYSSLFILKRVFASVRYSLDRLKLKIPIMGEIIIKIEMAVFCKFFAITYISGIEIMKCIDISVGVVKNIALRSSIAQSTEYIKNGMGLAESLSMTKQFPGLVLQMFKVGEDSGDLYNVLQHIDSLYNSEIKASIEMIIGILKPTMIIIIGLLLLWIIASIFGPIYGSFQTL